MGPDLVLNPCQKRENPKVEIWKISMLISSVCKGLIKPFNGNGNNFVEIVNDIL